MKIQRFNQFNAIHEGAIMPYNLDGVFDGIRKNLDSIETISDLNKYIGNDVIEFIDYDTFYKTALKTEKEYKSVPPRDMDILSGIQFALANKYTKKINIVVLPIFVDNIKSDRLQMGIFRLLMEIIRHESVHLQQGESSDKAYSLERSPSTDSKAYFTHHSEQMAFACSYVDSMRDKGYTKERMLEVIRKKMNTGIWIQNVYNKFSNEKQYKRFTRYVYDYINGIES